MENERTMHEEKNAKQIFEEMIYKRDPLHDDVINLVCPRCLADLYPFANQPRFTLFCLDASNIKETIRFLHFKNIKIYCLFCGHTWFEHKENKYCSNAWLVNICKELIKKLKEKRKPVEITSIRHTIVGNLDEKDIKIG